MQNKKLIKNIFFIGALLIVGLLFYLNRKTDNLEIRSLKPSQLDFSKSNEIQVSESSTTPSLEKPKLDKKMEPPVGLSEQSQRVWSVLEEVLESKNDNDSRLDTELKTLSPEMHDLLYKKYDSLEMENRNGRGMIAFLVARDLKTVEDTEFLRKIYQESPCTSLGDCKSVASEDPHISGINQTTLMYPQLAGLYQLEAKLSRQPEILKDPNLKDGIIATLKQAAGFPVPVVQKKAEEVKARFGL